MKKVLITGGAGFIGYHLGKNLAEKDYHVVLADNFARGISDRFLNDLSSLENVQIMEANLLDEGFLNNLDTDFNIIFHLAAIIGVKHVLNAPYKVLSQNVRLLENMIRAGKMQKQLQRFVFTSTSEIYAGTLKHFSLQIPTPEATPLALTDLEENRTSYMLSKIYGEAMCLHSGLPVTIIRPHNFYGPRMGLSHAVPELFRKAVFSETGTLEVFSPDHRRTFCYIDDAVEMIKLLGENEAASGKAFNVGNQTPELTIRELAKKIITISGRKLTVKDGPVTSGSPERRCPDMTRAFETIGYSPVITVEEGLRRTFSWYTSNVFSGSGISAV